MTGAPDPAPGSFSGPVSVRSEPGPDWVLLADLTYTALDGHTWTARRGMTTDFASVPRLTAWLCPRTGRWNRAAVIHDRLYRVDVPCGHLGHRRADQLLREMLRIERVSLLLRWLMWVAVRWSALVRGPAARRDLLRDLPAVLAVTVLALPIVAPPALLVAVALAVWWAAEQVAYAASLAWAPRGRYVNPPRDLTRT